MSIKKRAPKKVAINYNNGKIYKIVNDVNDKIYIGSTTTELSKRMCSHKCMALKETSQFYKAMQEIGVGHFRIMLIKAFPCKAKAELEAEEFAVTNTFDKAQLYNSMFNQKHSAETRQKISLITAGANNPRFSRGSIRFYQKSASSCGFNFQWCENGKQKTKCFGCGSKRTREEAHALALAFQNEIYPLTEE